MRNPDQSRDNTNLSEASREVKCRELAILDWAKTPSNRVREILGGLSWVTISQYRDTPEYKDTVQTLREEFQDMVRRLPDTRELKSRISLGMTLSLDRLIEVLNPGGKSATKDVISAARLMAQLDGRFLRGDEDEDGKGTNAVDSVAQELLTALKRQERVN